MKIIVIYTWVRLKYAKNTSKNTGGGAGGGGRGPWPLTFLQNNRAYFKIFCYECQIFPWLPHFPTFIGAHVM